MGRVARRRLLVGLIGAGRIVEQVHMPVLSRMSDVLVSAVFDIDHDRALAIAAIYGIPHVCRTLDELLGLDLDFVLVAGPNHLHGALSISALRAGKHVLCEKPMALGALEARSMLDAAQDSGKVLMIGFAQRFRPEVGALYQAIQKGQIGDVHSIRCGWLRHHGIPGLGTWFTDQAQAGGGVLTDLGSHLIDLAIWLSGRRRVLATCCVVNNLVEPAMAASWYKGASVGSGEPIYASCNVEVCASGFAVLDGPVDVFVEVSWSCPVPSDRTYLTVTGSRGAARLETLFGLSPNGHRPRYPLQIWQDGQSRVRKVAGAVNLLQPYRVQWRTFVDLLHHDQHPLGWLQDSLATVEVVEALYKSAWKHPARLSQDQ